MRFFIALFVLLLPYVCLAQPYVPSPYIFLNQPNTWGQPQTFNGGVNTPTINGQSVVTPNSDISNNPSTSTGASAGLTQAARGAYTYHVEDFEPASLSIIPGTTDETTYIVAALTAAQLTSGWVVLQNRQYYHASSFTVPSLVLLTGSTYPHYNSSGGISGEALDAPLFISGPGATITVNGGFRNFAQARAGVNLNVTASLQAEIANVATFSGTGITVGESATVENGIIFGNAVAIQVTNHENWYINNIRGDDLSGLVINGMYNYSWANNINFQPFLSANFTTSQATITGVADNGSGVIRVTTSAAHGFITGNRVVVNGVLGFVGANGTWTVSYVDATHFDLTGSASSPSFTGTTTNGSNVLSFPSTVNKYQLVSSQNISGTGIPGATTISAGIAYPLNELKLSNNATATGSATMTVTNPTYISGGTATVSALYRPGPCLSVQTAQNFTSTGYACYGFNNPAIYLGTQAGNTSLTGVSILSDVDYDPTSVGLQIGGTSGQTAYGTVANINNIDGFWQTVQVFTTSAKAHHIIGSEIYSSQNSQVGPAAFQLTGTGTVQLSGYSCGGVYERFFIGSGTKLITSDLNCPSSIWDFGSTLTNVQATVDQRNDFSGNVIRGPTINMVVPNSAGTAFQSALTASINGVQFSTSTVVNSLPTCNSANTGLTSAVTDAASPTYLGTLTGGGSTYAPVVCNGTSWVSH